MTMDTSTPDTGLLPRTAGARRSSPFLTGPRRCLLPRERAFGPVQGFNCTWQSPVRMSGAIVMLSTYAPEAGPINYLGNSDIDGRQTAGQRPRRSSEVSAQLGPDGTIAIAVRTP